MLKKMFLGAILATLTPLVWARDGELYAKIGAHETSMTLSYVDFHQVTQTNTYSNAGQEPGRVTDQAVWAGYGVAVHGIDHPGHKREILLYAPEATTSKIDFLHRATSSKRRHQMQRFVLALSVSSHLQRLD